jgi:hypothetical protein
MTNEEFELCSKLLTAASKRFYAAEQSLKNAYIREVKDIDKKFGIDLFNKDAIEAERMACFEGMSKDAAEMIAYDDVSIYGAIIDFFIEIETEERISKN